MKIVFKYTALEPISHGGEMTLSTITPFRKIKVLTDLNTMSYAYVPVISGNSMRGKWRRFGSKKLLEMLKIKNEILSPKMYHILFSGGALEKGDEMIDIGFKKKIRRLLPHISMFGAAFEKFILEGRMQVGMVFPVVKELYQYTGIETNISFYDIRETIFYTRRDDLEESENATEMPETTQMKYEIEVLVPGTELIQVVYLHGNEVENAAFTAAFNRWMENPYIGGAHRVGHGRVKVEILEGTLPDETPYKRHVEEYKNEILEFLENHR